MGIQWKEDLATGVSEIDHQHKELFNRLNILLDACNQGKGRLEVGKVIAFLEEYVVTHFNAEEKLQQKHLYPGFLAHKAEHTQFVKEFAEIKKKFETEGATVTFVGIVNRKVSGWIIDHIKKMDKAFGEYLKTKK